MLVVLGSNSSPVTNFPNIPLGLKTGQGPLNKCILVTLTVFPDVSFKTIIHTATDTVY
jgi:hypothetical protein